MAFFEDHQSMRKTTIAFVLILICCHVVVAEDNTSEMKPIEYQELGKGVWMYTSFMPITGYPNFPTNGVIAMSADEAVIVDMPVNAEYTHALFDWIEAQGKKVRYVVPQHFHEDSTGGLKTAQQRGAQVVMLDKTEQLQVPAYAVEADIIFSSEVRLRYGNEQLLLTHMGGGHSADSVVAWLQKPKLLVGGCLIKSGASKSLGNTADAVMTEYAETLNAIQARFPNRKIITPGHGKPGDNLVQHTLQLVKEHKAKMSLENM